jgi:hypothetical protein
MSKHKKKRRNIKISPMTTLRPRLDNLWADHSLLHKEDAAIGGDLDVVARDVEPEFLLRTMLQAYRATSEPARARLSQIVPRWMSKRNFVGVLKEIVLSQSLDPGAQSVALAWLGEAGVDTQALENQPSLFLDAYYYDDEAILGEKSQAYVAVFWHTSPRKHRAEGIGFLLDYNPPWDGSVKDVFKTPRRAPQKLLKDVLNVWRDGGMEPWSISAEQAKTVILTALNCNQAANLRLPRDLIAVRELFDRYVLSLPDAPDTPSFTMEAFDLLARDGKPPEEVIYFERTVGRRVRLEDGSEVMVMGDSDDWEDEDW